MFLAHLDGSDPGAKIYDAQRIPDPPDHSAFNRGGGGGGSGIGNNMGAHLDGSGRSA
jgi:hypothetical protein